MPLNFLKKKEKEKSPPVPEFQFIRSDTHNVTAFDPETDQPITSPSSSSRPRSASKSERLKVAFGRHRRGSDVSVNIPAELPEIEDTSPAAEEKWEKRATMLARAASPSIPVQDPSIVSVTKGDDDNIQEAIRLHEAGDLEKSTAMFKNLANPATHNNPLSQVLYGLALRHGWGVPVDTAEAIKYLKLAASSSAVIEEQALTAGMKKGGAAKGELVLAIFELANCFRHGWGVEKDPTAAFQYYLTAANLGDSDAQNEVAWCYLEGFGCKKSRYDAAKYYRLAEKQGNKILGNTWIWKDKYNDR